MKRFYAMTAVLSVCLTPSLFAAALMNSAQDATQLEPAACADCGAERAENEGPYACPQFPIMVLSSGTVYYADFYDPDCDAEVQATYMVGEFDYPQYCPDCYDVPSLQYEYEGTTSPLSLAADESRWDRRALTSQELVSQAFPIWDAIGTSIHAEEVGWIRLTVGPRERFAVVFCVEFLRGGKTGSARGWNERFVAVEVDEVPDDEQPGVTKAISPQALPGGYAYRAKFETSNNRLVPVLILMSR